MIIGIHGKKGHGKDLLASTMRFLIAIHKDPTAFYGHIPLPKEAYAMVIDNIHKSGREEDKSGWVKKMFAYKLKLYVCSLIGCTMEQLEDQDFKEKPLGPEWDKWYIYNATYCLERGMFTSEAEAKAAYAKISNPRLTNPQELHTWYSPLGDIKIEFRKYVMTPRLMLQLAGTQGGRDVIHPNMHVNALFVDYKGEAEYQGFHIDPNKRHIVKYPNWIITDVRFRNECQAIKNREGLIFKIYRPGMDDSSRHESETALDDVPNSQFDGFILNNGVSDYINVIMEQAEILLRTHKII